VKLKEVTVNTGGSPLSGSIPFINRILRESAEKVLPLTDIEGKNLILKEISRLKTGVSKRPA
jgi:hypothetical protein